jgi:ribonuclease J
MQVIPVGGCGEFGRNLTAYRAGSALVLIDCGVQMPDDTTPGVDFLCPDVEPLLERYGPPTAVVLTHGHEDHIGALGHLLNVVGEPIPVYGRKLTLKLCERCLTRLRVPGRLRDLRELPLGAPLWLRSDGAEDGIAVTPLAVPHSIPEACALLIEGPLRTDDVLGPLGELRVPRPLPQGAYAVLHTGDYKLEEFADALRLQGSGLAGGSCPPVDLLVGDSTNAQVPGRAASERTVEQALRALLLDERPRGRVALTLFASHIQRIAHFAESCRQAGRKVCLLGRGLHETTEAAVAAQVLKLPAELLCTPEEAASRPPHQVALVCTGTQGEAMAALSKLVAALDRSVPSPFGGLRLAAGDTVVLSARTIPGNERQVGRLCDALAEAGIRVRSGPEFAASGHGCQDELRALMRQVRPRAVLPVHGAPRMLHAHADLAEELGIPALRCRDGDVVQVGEHFEVVDRIPTGAIVYEGESIGQISGETLRQRRLVHVTGVVAVATRPGQRTRLVVRTIGVRDRGPALQALCAEAERAGEEAMAVTAAHHPKTEELSADAAAAAVRAVRATFRRVLGTRPTVVSLLGAGSDDF